MLYRVHPLPISILHNFNNASQGSINFQHQSPTSPGLNYSSYWYQASTTNVEKTQCILPSNSGTSSSFLIPSQTQTPQPHPIHVPSPPSSVSASPTSRMDSNASILATAPQDTPWRVWWHPSSAVWCIFENMEPPNTQHWLKSSTITNSYWCAVPKSPRHSAQLYISQDKKLISLPRK